MNKKNYYDEKLKNYFCDYNILLSNARLENFDKISSIASPTLNKQETVTFLYQRVLKHIKGERERNIKSHSWFKFYIRLFYRFYQLSRISLIHKVREIPLNCIFFRTWIVPRTVQDNNVKDDYFRDLIKDLEKKNEVIIAFQPLSFDKALRKFEKLKKPSNYIIPIGFLNINDILKVIIKYLLFGRSKLKKKYYFKKVEISKLINDSLDNDFFNFHSFQFFLDYEIARKLKKFQISKFFYIYENQAWEKAYIMNLEKKHTKIIGYQSSGFSFRFLNFFPSKLDSKNNLFPHKIITVGDVFTKTLTDYGCYPIPIETFGALRFNSHNSKNNKFIVSKPETRIFKRILYAFSVHFWQYEIILRDLVEIFKNDEIEVHLKFHPMYQKTHKMINLPPNFKVWSSSNNFELKEKYDVVLFNDNSFGIESLIAGVMSFEYLIDQYYDEKRLFDFRLYDPILNKKSLLILRDKILNNTLRKSISKSKLEEYINNIYTVYPKK
jgi:hypothetical protein